MPGKMTSKIDITLKKEIKKVNFIYNQKNSSENSKSIIILFLLSLFILCASSIDTVQAEEVIGNSSNDTSYNDTNSTNDINDTSSSENNSIVLNKSEILNSGTQVANFIERNKKLPNTVSVGDKVFTISQYLYAVTSFISGSDNVTLFDVSGKIYSVSRFSTSYTLSQYTDLAKRTKNYMYNYKTMLPYISSAHGNLDYYNMIYMFSKIARYYDKYGKMPVSVSLESQIPSTARLFSSTYVDQRISSLSSQLKTTRTSMSKLAATIKKTKNLTTLKKLQNQFNSLQSKYNSLNSLLSRYKSLRSSAWYVPYSMRKYLKETRYIKLTNGNVVYVAMNLRGNTPYETGLNIFNWVRDNLDYSFYYRTKYGASKALQYRLGNCVDQAHLIVALARTSGLPARYVRGTCKFIVSGHTYSHVWAQIWIKGRGWVTADPTNYRNSFGVIRSWDPAKSKISGTLIEYSL